ncbi:OmpH family outer membrane protein [Aureispira anguillae]|uniref:OmpH family outer membrane protein n=1 Tax=Aureispira anguillae TaxID=2864201 RepID=A0A915YCD4_9BACT|nr:OmpH family outer membrane protein [Aureispira anguillae]BDS10485.1 OmpH family outer membrane protein [Aureispira anguillae]
MKRTTLLQLLSVTVLTVWMIWLTIGMNSQPKVAYVHSEYLFENYLGTIESYKVLEAKTKKWGDNLDSLSKSYRATFISYDTHGEKLHLEEKAKLGRKLQQQEQVFNKYHESVEKMKLEEDQKLTQSVIKQIDAYLKEYALKNGYDLIIGAGTSSSLVYGGKGYDVTDDVLNFINQKYRGE